MRTLSAPEDAVLVLDHDDVIASPIEHPCCRGVVAALILVDPGDDLGRLVDIVLTDDRHDVDGRHTVSLEQRLAQVPRERPDPARPRWIGRDDSDAHRRGSRQPRAAVRPGG